MKEQTWVADAGAAEIRGKGVAGSFIWYRTAGARERGSAGARAAQKWEMPGAAHRFGLVRTPGITGK